MESISEASLRATVDGQTENRISQMIAEAETLDDAWRLFGVAQGDSATGEDPVERGKHAFKRRFQELRAIFCEKSSIRAIVQNPAVDKEIDLALLLAGALLHQNYPGSQIAPIAVLVAKIGVIRFCMNTYSP